MRVQQIVCRTHALVGMCAIGRNTCYLDIVHHYNRNNYASSGGAVYGAYGAAMALKDSTFDNNTALLYAGAAYIGSKCKADIANTSFYFGSATYGGMWIQQRCDKLFIQFSYTQERLLFSGLHSTSTTANSGAFLYGQVFKFIFHKFMF